MSLNLNFKFKLILILAVSLFILISIEIFGYFIINFKKNEINQQFYNEEKKKAVFVYQKYREFIPYVRNPQYFDYIDNVRSPSENDKVLFYTILNPFLKSNRENVLIQGDSWAEAANDKEIKNYLQKKSSEINVGMINSGISSYSPGPMTAQLNILRNDFNIRPSILISIIDQTDIGDELYRHNTFDKNLTILRISNSQIKYNEKINQILSSRKFNFLKLFEYFSLYFNNQKKIYKINSFKTFKFILFRLSNRLLNIPIQLTPLFYDIDSFKKNKFRESLNFYIKNAFKDQKLEKIIFVTHPHKKHYLGGIIGKYKIDVGDLLIDVINKSQYKDKIIHLDFRKILFEKNIENIEKLFVQNDIFSHLTIEAYIKYYFPEILKII